MTEQELKSIAWSKIKIEEGVPLVKHRTRPSKYQRLYNLVDKMKAGQSVLLPVNGPRLQNVLQTAFPDFRIATRATEGGLRIYKLAKED